jgi:hypothetical protein
MREPNDRPHREQASQTLERFFKRRHGSISIAVRPQVVNETRHRHSSSSQGDDCLQQFEQPVRRFALLSEQPAFDSYLKPAQRLDLKRPTILALRFRPPFVQPGSSRWSSRS